METMGLLVLLLMIAAISIATYVHNQQKEKEALNDQLMELKSEIQKKEENMSEQKNKQFQIEEQKQSRTRELFLETLEKIGCQYNVDEEDNTKIYFAYQGENFIVDASNDRHFVTLWDAHWGSVELYDVEEVSRLTKAINGSNVNNLVTAIYTILKEEGLVCIHSKSIFLFVPEIPELEEYLRMILYEFFRVHHFIGNEMAKLREQESSVQS